MTEENIDWEELYLVLYAYTKWLLKNKYWFSGKKTSFFLKGKEAHDYVSEAIERYLRNPEKFDKSRGNLVNYLKLNLIRSMVSNDFESYENKNVQNILGSNPFKYEDNNSNYLDSILPHLDEYFDEQLDYDKIMTLIEKEIKDDGIVEEIFIGICCEGLKRSEIIEEFGMSENDYDNGYRRLRTIMNKVAIKFDIKE